jgi:hypothetical protein
MKSAEFPRAEPSLRICAALLRWSRAAARIASTCCRRLSQLTWAEAAQAESAQTTPMLIEVTKFNLLDSSTASLPTRAQARCPKNRSKVPIWTGSRKHTVEEEISDSPKRLSLMPAGTICAHADTRCRPHRGLSTVFPGGSCLELRNPVGPRMAGRPLALPPLGGVFLDRP